MTFLLSRHFFYCLRVAPTESISISRSIGLNRVLKATFRTSRKTSMETKIEYGDSLECKITRKETRKMSSCFESHGPLRISRMPEDYGQASVATDRQEQP